MRIGILGGTFDPPHLGHLILAVEALVQLDLESILFVLTPTPPHKLNRAVTPIETRIRLLLAAISQESNFHLSRVDIDRQPPHYALDTVRLLKREYEKDHLTYLMGGDSLVDLPTWYKPAKFISECSSIAVMDRPSEIYDLNALDSILPGITSKLIQIHTPLLEISSSDIRFRVKEGKPYRYFVPELVYQIINNEYLYRNF